jgi:hypothetical protein
MAMTIVNNCILILLAFCGTLCMGQIYTPYAGARLAINNTFLKEIAPISFWKIIVLLHDMLQPPNCKKFLA